MRTFSELVTLVIVAGLTSTVLLAGRTIQEQDFESGELGYTWESLTDDPEHGGFERRPEHVHSGNVSYRITAPAHEGPEEKIHGYAYKQSDSWIRTWFLPGEDRIFVRWYAKFAEDFDQTRHMHWCGLRGCRADKPRSGFGRAGERPDGWDRFTTSIEPFRDDSHDPPGQICFYTYWPGMEQSGDGKYWGNRFYMDPPFYIERGRWYCFELMVKLNDVGRGNGEQALWIDGEKLYHQEGMRWRLTELLKLNLFKFGLYIHYNEQDCTYWVDDMVISTDYVGPLKDKASAGK